MKRLCMGAGLLAALLAVGCESARMVHSDGQGGCVAIPSNYNGWPCHYRDEAEKLMRQKCPQGYVIEREEEVVVGQTSTTHSERKGASQELIKNSGLSLNSEQTRQETHVQDKTEWRIWFRAATGQPSGIVQAGAVTPAK